MSQKRLIWQQDGGLNFAARWGNEKEMSKEDHVIFYASVNISRRQDKVWHLHFLFMGTMSG